jgi:outer membrane protein TolC
LGQGLIIDHRRATIRQAQLLGDLAEAERVSIINKLLLQATKDYWDWLFTYNKLKLHQEAYELAQFRFEAVKRRAAEGDLSRIDTVEAKIEVQNRLVLLQQSGVDYQNASLILSNHLWGSDDTPLEITDDVAPDTTMPEDAIINRAELEELIASAKINHPDILKLHVKKEQLGIEKKFLADRLKPRVNVEYNVMQRGFPIETNNMNNGFISNNYKLSFSISFSLR